MTFAQLTRELERFRSELQTLAANGRTDDAIEKAFERMRLLLHRNLHCSSSEPLGHFAAHRYGHFPHVGWPDDVLSRDRQA